MKAVFFFLLLPVITYSSELKDYFQGKQKLSPQQFEQLQKGEITSFSNVESSETEQMLDLYVAAIHPKKCNRALRKISLYEKYSNFMDFITKSTYDESKQEIYLLFEHSVLPSRMYIKFKIPRVKKEGKYPFIFEEGMFLGLKGNIHVKKYGRKCIMYMDAHWIGKKTKFPNVVMEAFSQTLTRLTLDKLIRISKF